MQRPSKAANAGDKVASSAAADPGLSAKVLVCNCKLKCIIRLVVIQSSTIKLDQVVYAQATYKSHPFARFFIWHSYVEVLRSQLELLVSGLCRKTLFVVSYSMNHNPLWNCFLFQAYVVIWHCLFLAYVVKLYSL